jgi:hypothetical protein
VAATNAPADVGNFSGYGSSSSVVLSWSAVGGADHYEIRYADSASTASWNTASVLWDGTALTWTDSTRRAGVYMIVAVSSLATGSIESITPSTFQVSSSTSASSSVLAQDPGTLSVAMSSSTGVGAKFTVRWPDAAAYMKDGTYRVMGVSSQNNIFSGYAIGTTYYIYMYLTLVDGELYLNTFTNSGTIQLTGAVPTLTPSSLTLDTAPNSVRAAQAISLGLWAWCIIANSSDSSAQVISIS